MKTLTYKSCVINPNNNSYYIIHLPPSQRTTMGGSRRKYKRSRTNKVRVGLPKKNPNVFKPAFSIPPKFRSLVDLSKTKWDDQGSVLENYKTFGVVSNPNLLGVWFT